MKALSIAKIGEGTINEDAARVTQKWIAVSDGAGGGGVFADKWSKYLLEHLPEKPIKDFQCFDKWIESIWEPFYNEYEEKAKKESTMLLSKFYDEGSFATLAVVWVDGTWISYGDSVAFCYKITEDKLEHSFGRLTDFNKPPYLVNCKDPLNEKGFRCGKFSIDDDCIAFVASDALAHYILMMYEASHRKEFAEELQEALKSRTKNSNYIETAMSFKMIDFIKTVQKKLLNCNNTANFRRHLQSCLKNGLIAHDDYSLAIM